MTKQTPKPTTDVNMQNYRAAMLRIAYALVLLLVTMLGWGLVRSIGAADSYWSLLGLLFIASYILLAPALVMLIMGKTLPRLIRLVANGFVGILIVALAILAFGNIQDAMGVHCTGFFGAATSCSENQFFLVFILFLNPFTLVPIFALSLIGLTKGWRDHLKATQTK
jgi:hypothetical protein